MRIPGIERRKKLKDEIAAFPILVKIHRGETVEVKQRKERAKETKPRDLREAKFRNEEVYPFLRKDRRIKRFKRIENSIGGRKAGKGLPDFIFWTYKRQYWLELKAPGEKLTDEQEEIRDECVRTNQPFIVAETIKDITDAIAIEEAAG